MNPTKLRILADRIEQADPASFDMSSWFTSSEDNEPLEEVPLHGGGIGCGTAGCIAGWAVSVFLPPEVEVEEDAIERTAIDLLEADDWRERDTLDALFYSPRHWRRLGYEHVDRLSDITQEMAATELRNLAATL